MTDNLVDQALRDRIPVVMDRQVEKMRDGVKQLLIGLHDRLRLDGCG